MNRRSTAFRTALVGLSVFGVASAAFASPPSWTRDRDARYDRDSEYARVVNAEPIVRRVRVTTPDRECWSEDRPVYSGPSHTEIKSTIIGGLIGAAVGSHIGVRTREPAAIVGGSLIGAAIGNSIGANRAARNGDYRNVDYRPVERCEVRYHEDFEDQVDGYRVTYVYHGREYTTRMPYDPGSQIRVNVDVSPIQGRE